MLSNQVNSNSTRLISKFSPDFTLQISKTRLSLSHHFSKDLTHDILTDFLSETTKKLKTTSHLYSLTLSFLENIPEPQHFQKFSLLTKNIKYLKELRLHLPLWQFHHFSDYLQAIRKILRTTKHLQKFELLIFDSQFPPAARTIFASFIAELRFLVPKLTDLNILYGHGESIVNDGNLSNSPLFIMSSGFKSLSSLTLDFAVGFFFSMNLDFSPLKGLENLRDLSLNVWNANNLTERFAVCENNPQVFLHNYFPNLQHLKISLTSNFAHATKEIIFFTYKLSISLPKLTDVSLAVHLYQPITEQEFWSLAAHLTLGIKNLKSLSLLVLGLTFTPQILSHLSFLLLHKNLQNLEALSLYFSECKSLSNIFMTKLAENITKNLINLRKLHLFMKDAKTLLKIRKASNIGLAKFGEIIAKKNRGLEEISLEFEGFLKISDEGVRRLCDHLENIQDLKRVSLKFKDCKKITVEAQNYVKEKLRIWRKQNLNFFRELFI